MKSIIEEASSINKAIYNGWLKAKRPAEFSVKIFEEPEKGWFGLFTKKPAKIGIFFHEAVEEVRVERGRRQPRQEFRTRQPRPEGVQQQQRAQGQQQQQPRPQQQQQQQRERPTAVWTPEMVQAARSWIDNNVSIIRGSALPYTVQTQNHALTIRFEANVLSDRRKELIFFKNSAQLIIQSLQLKFKKPALFGLKITLLSA